MVFLKVLLSGMTAPRPEIVDGLKRAGKLGPPTDVRELLPLLIVVTAASAAEVMVVAHVIMAVFIAYAGVLFLPSLIAMPVMFKLIRKWERPARILLLRPFNDSWVSRHLRRLVHVELARFGHVYTLADPLIRIPWYVRIPVFLGQLSLFSFRRITVQTPLDIEAMARMLWRTRMRTINWCVSSSKIFPLYCSTQAWQSCVARLILEVDVIILDLTGLRQGVLFELALLRRLGAFSKVIAIVEKQFAEEAARVYQEAGGKMVGVRSYDRDLVYDAKGVSS